jgi:hypothetical protein
MVADWHDWKHLDRPKQLCRIEAAIFAAAPMADELPTYLQSVMQ